MRFEQTTSWPPKQVQSPVKFFSSWRRFYVIIRSEKKIFKTKNISKDEVRTNEIGAASPFARPNATFLVITSFLLDVKKHFKEKKKNIPKVRFKQMSLGPPALLLGRIRVFSSLRHFCVIITCCKKIEKDEKYMQKWDSNQGHRGRQRKWLLTEHMRKLFSLRDILITAHQCKFTEPDGKHKHTTEFRASSARSSICWSILIYSNNSAPRKNNRTNWIAD